MPKRRKREKEENWSGMGILVGVVFGGPVYYVALGYLDPLPIVRFIVRVVTLIILLVGSSLAIYHAIRKKARIDPFLEGIITGFCFIAFGIDLYLHGIPFF